VKPRRSAERLLRCYPPRWRVRYGDELAALVEEELADRPRSIMVRVDVVRGGFVTRLRESGLTGDSVPAAERVRAGVLLVGAAWSLAVVAGAAVATYAERWAQAAPARARSAPAPAFYAVQVAAWCAVAAFAAGAVLVAPALWSRLRDARWRETRPHVAVAGASSLVTAGATVALVTWVHRLQPAIRDGAQSGDHVVGALWALLRVVTVAAFTVAGIAALRRVPLDSRLLRAAGLAVTVAASLCALLAGVVTWWASLAAASAPWFAASGGAGPSTASWSPSEHRSPSPRRSGSLEPRGPSPLRDGACRRCPPRWGGGAVSPAAGAGHGWWSSSPSAVEVAVGRLWPAYCW